MYQVLFGENPDPEKMDSFKWVIYVFFTLVIIIVCLNLLISIISDGYDHVKTEEKATDVMSKLLIMRDFGELKQFFTRKQGKLGYIHFFHYNDHALAGDLDDTTQSTKWEGKIKKL